MKATDSAFPIIVKTEVIDGGMDIRTYLAGQAMQGILSRTGYDFTFSGVSKTACDYADALIKELNKEKK